MNNQQYVQICIGIMIGMAFVSGLNALETIAQPKNIHHHVSIDKCDLSLEGLQTVIED